MGLFTGGFLVAIGYGVVVFSVVAAALIVLATFVFAAAWRRVQRRLGGGLRRLRRGTVTTAAALPPLCRQTWSRARPRIESGGRTGATATRRAVAFTGRALATLPPLLRQLRLHAQPSLHAAHTLCVRAGASAKSWAIQTAQGTTVLIVSRTQQTDPRRHALRLNVDGTQYRRDGKFDQAADCHRGALEIFQALDDRKAVALTQSNLALALSHAGDDNWAIGLFEEAAATLHELGDEEHEAQIIANLGLAHRRHGRPEEGNNVLQLALSKLPPASSEYQAIEAELSRAS